MMAVMRWEFDDPPNVAVFTSKAILEGRDWIQYVSHDEDDGAWQFHPAGGTPENEASLVSLRSIVELDPSVSKLCDLPLGWCASRATANGQWKREANNPNLHS